jgi:hypothetical protein
MSFVVFHFQVTLLRHVVFVRSRSPLLTIVDRFVSSLGFSFARPLSQATSAIAFDASLGTVPAPYYRHEWMLPHMTPGTSRNHLAPPRWWEYDSGEVEA